MIPADPTRGDDVPADGAARAAFQGPGEMRRRFRETDWSATPLGPVADWSPVLRVMAEVCLESGFPMVVSWGPKVVMLYNDAYIPLLGGDLHPAALGRSAKKIWPDAWPVTGPFVTEVMDRGGSIRRDDMQMVLERNGYPEECYFTFAHSPIRDPSGGVVGMLTVAAETTGHVLHRRRLGVVQQLGGLSATHFGSPAQTCQAALDILSQARATLPFAAVYLRRDLRGPAHQVTRYGVADDVLVPGLTSAPEDNQIIVKTVLATGQDQVATGLRERFPDAFLPGPLGPLRPDEAVVVPLIVTGRDTPVGVIVLGVNPYRPLDAAYREFFALIGRQLSVALADSLAYEHERVRATALADLDQVKTEFFQNVSHELRTPLTLLLAPLQDLLTSPTLPGAAKADLEAAVRAAERLRRMVDALLDFSRSSSGTLVPDLQDTDLAALTADIASMFRSTAEHAGISFKVEVPDDGRRVGVDPAMWTTIVNNLLSNAVKYTSSGSISVRLGYPTPPPPVDGSDGPPAVEQIELTVADTGIGIAPDDRELIFERFHRTAAGAANHGAGIGLALVADLVRAHDGSIEVSGAPGAGTQMTVVLPAATMDAPAGTLAPAPVLDPAAVPLPAGVAPPGNASSENDSASTGKELSSRPPTGSSLPVNATLLLVEDDSDLRAYLTRLLGSDGWTVDAVGDAESALALVFDENRTPPNLILSDVMLPGQSGIDLLIALRNHKGTARVPVILLTARAGVDTALDGLHHGADDFVTKPFSSAELLARVRVHHELNQLREDALGQAQTKAVQLRAALDSNRVIGTAVGMLTGSLDLTAAEAFQVMVRASQNVNRKLRDIAADVISTGRLPFPAELTADLIQAVRDRPVQRPR